MLLFCVFKSSSHISLCSSSQTIKFYQPNNIYNNFTFKIDDGVVSNPPFLQYPKDDIEIPCYVKKSTLWQRNGKYNFDCMSFA